ncbi:hypothetical protein [Motiliproteus sp. SC1-56]|uniref:hypothetical protein n=1 Tax=Motiliproteus sp. SC1-56 TaxID=2799565 RepID=UPI001A8FABA0|nr:hypothetical protein [Motiliproteus sp. SC1-56]
MRYFAGVMAVVMVALSGCGGSEVRPQAEAGAGSTASAPPSAGQEAVKKTPVVQHNLSKVAEAKPVTAAQLEALTVGETTRDQVVELLGANTPFTLGDGKSILRYDVGKFIFDGENRLLRKFLAP